MSIADELREYARIHQPYKSELYNAQCADEITAIADRIDAEHERLMVERADRYSELRTTMKERYIELPKDADGEYIHVGDVLTDDAEFRSEGEVVRLMLEGEDWFVGFDRRAGWAELSIHEWHHHHAQTVEDVLREFAEAMNENMGMYTGEAIDADEWRDADAKTVEKYAAKLRLAEGED